MVSQAIVYVFELLPDALGFLCRSGELLEPMVLNLYILAAGSVVGLAYVWAGLSKRNWFLRIGAVQVIASVPLAIPAYELVIWFFTQSVVTIPPLLLFGAARATRQSADRVDSRKNAPRTHRDVQWSIRDQLLLCVLLSGLAAAAVQIPSEVWRSWIPLVLVGSFFGLSTLVASWAALSQRCFRLRFAAVCFFPPSIVIACWLALLRTCRGHTGSVPSWHRTTRLAYIVLAAYSLLLFAPPAVMFCLLVKRLPIPASPELPDPNGYDDLSRAAKMLSTTSRDPAAPDAELRELTAVEIDALAIAREGLSKPCQVPLDYSSGPNADGALFARPLRAALQIEGELAEKEGRPADAARSYLDMLLVRRSLSHGGTLMDAMFVNMPPNSACLKLHEIRGSLTSSQCRELARGVYLFNRSTEPLEVLVARDEVIFDRSSSWQERLGERISALYAESADLYFRQFYGALHAQPRLVMYGLALQAYHLDNGVWPHSLADLIPRYLPEVLKDPFNGEHNRYRRTSQGYRLYYDLSDVYFGALGQKEDFDFSYEGVEAHRDIVIGHDCHDW